MDLKLTEYEREMLEGKRGRLKQVAMKNIVRYAEILGAKELVEVTKATVFSGAHLYLDILETEDMNEIFSRMSMAIDEVLHLDEVDGKCFTQSCVSPADRKRWEEIGVTPERNERNEKSLKYYSDGGVAMVGSCIPYQAGWIPIMGEHFVTSESHVILLCNSVFGACGNSDGLESGFWSMICGRTPKWGNHIMDNRKGTHVFNIECRSDRHIDWDLIGYTIGKKLPNHSIPVINGDFVRPDIDKLKLCFASMATTSGAEMCHIVGITPEAMTLEQALGNKEPVETITITDDDILESMKELCSQGHGNIDFVSLGCPHYSVEQIGKVAKYLEGKKIKEGVTLQVWTTESLKTIADDSGYTDIIREAGGGIYTGSCPIVAGIDTFKDAKGMAFDGGKQAHYIKSETDADIYYGTMYECLDSAITGKWEGFKVENN